MLRLSVEEHTELLAAKAQGEELASFARRRLLAALAPVDETPSIREAAAFIVAALSTELEFDEAARLFDECVQPQRGATSHG